MKTAFFDRNLPVMLLAPVLGLIGLFSLAGTARADEGDPPTRVARISYVHRSVSFQPGGAGEWASAVVNRPVTIGDRIWSDSAARAELQAGAAAIHLDGNTALSFLNLDERTTQMRLAEGAIHFRVRELRSDDLYEVDTPSLAFTVTRAGAFRVDVNEAGDFTGVSVFRGEGEITTGGRSYKVRDGERAEFTGTDKLHYSVFPAPHPDKFDRWAMERDLREERSVSSRYVSRDVVGYEDLDEYGDWRDEPGYGHVWYPTAVYAGWAPYRYGNWSWVGPWGWTWVDYSPWGFAPYHYGRWAYINGSWGWCPGPLFVRPVYAPALVAFVGGNHWGMGFGFGAPVAWFPLGFGEPFFPSFRCSRTFLTNVNISNTVIRNVNIIHTTNVQNINFVNAHNVNAVTAVSQHAFANGEAVQRASVRVTPEMLHNAQVTTRAEVTPTPRSILGASSGGHVVTPPSAIELRPVFTRSEPAEAARHLPVRPANAEAPSATRALVSGPMAGRSGVPDVPPMSPRQHEMAQDKPQRYGENGRGAINLPETRNNPEVRSGMPQTPQNNDVRYGQRPAGRSLDRPDVAPQRSPVASQPSPEPRMRNDQRMNQADRPPWAHGGGSGVPDAHPMGSADRGAREISRPNEPSSPRTSPRNEPSYDRPTPQPRSESRPPARSVERPNRSDEPPRESPRPAPSYDRGQRAPESPRSSAPPPRAYSAPEARPYSAPRSYSAPPQRSYSPPPRSSGGSGEYSAPRGNSGGTSHGSSAPPSHASGGVSRERY